MVRLAASAAFIVGTLSGTFIHPVLAGRYDGTLTPGYVNYGWKYVGCANELTSGRALNSASFTSSQVMTIEFCMEWCRQRNYAYAGLENGQECYCGTGLQSGSALGATGCTAPCADNNREICGGSSRISVFHDETYGQLRSPSKIGTFDHVGCYREPLDGSKALPAVEYDTNTMTINECVNRCYTAGYAYAGVEYGRECWCDMYIHPGVIDANDPSGTYTCSQACIGDAGQPCGGSSIIDIYKNVYQ